MFFHCYFGATDNRYAIEEPHQSGGLEFYENVKWHFPNFYCRLTESKIINSIYANVNLYLWQELAEESEQFYENCKIEYFGEPGWLNRNFNEKGETSEDSAVIISPYYHYKENFYYGKLVIHPINVFEQWKKRGFPVTFYSGYILERNINDGWFNLEPYFKNFLDTKYFY